MTFTQASLQALYDQDFAAWIEATVACLKARDVSNLDWDNLIEEIADLGKSQRRELENRLEVLVAHVLKRQYVDLPDCYRGWQATIREHRNALRRLLEQSPSLKPYFSDVFDQIYKDALAIVREEYPQASFPDVCPFSREVEALLAEDFWQN